MLIFSYYYLIILCFAAYFKADPSVNVIILGWEQLPVYPMWFANVRGVGERLAEVLDYMVESGLLRLDRLHVTGHSLGAHVAAIAGEQLTSGRIGRITGKCTPINCLICKNTGARSPAPRSR